MLALVLAVAVAMVATAVAVRGTAPPTASPTVSPTLSPTLSPMGPTASPTAAPTGSPTLSPTLAPTASPFFIDPVEALFINENNNLGGLVIILLVCFTVIVVVCTLEGLRRWQSYRLGNKFTVSAATGTGDFSATASRRVRSERSLKSVRSHSRIDSSAYGGARSRRNVRDDGDYFGAGSGKRTASRAASRRRLSRAQSRVDMRQRDGSGVHTPLSAVDQAALAANRGSAMSNVEWSGAAGGGLGQSNYYPERHAAASSPVGGHMHAADANAYPQQRQSMGGQNMSAAVGGDWANYYETPRHSNAPGGGAMSRSRGHSPYAPNNAMMDAANPLMDSSAGGAGGRASHHQALPGGADPESYGSLPMPGTTLQNAGGGGNPMSGAAFSLLDNGTPMSHEARNNPYHQ